MPVKSQGTLWGVCRVGKDAHAVPIGDLRRHQKSRHCHCGPRFQDEDESPAWIGDSAGVVVVHVAYDGRPEE